MEPIILAQPNSFSPPIGPEKTTFGQETIAIHQAERLDRIGAILYRAACRLPSNPRSQETPRLNELTETEKRIYKAVMGLDYASPEQIQSLVGLSRATVARGLRTLREKGLLVSEGLTRNVRYSLPEQKNAPHRAFEF